MDIAQQLVKLQKDTIRQYEAIRMLQDDATSKKEEV